MVHANRTTQTQPDWQALRQDDAAGWSEGHDAEEWSKDHDAEEWSKGHDAEEWGSFDECLGFHCGGPNTSLAFSEPPAIASPSYRLNSHHKKAVVVR